MTGMGRRTAVAVLILAFGVSVVAVAQRVRVRTGGGPATRQAVAGTRPTTTGAAAAAKRPTTGPAPAVARDVRYGPAAGSGNLLDVYYPADAVGRLPCVVWIHGGAWLMGDKMWPHGLGLVPRGFVVVSVNYRLSTIAPYPAQIYDCKGAVRFLRAHAAEYHIDPDHIGVWGESAGGHLAALLGTSGGDPKLEGDVGGNLDRSSRVQAVVDWFGPTDLTKFAAQALAAKITLPDFEWTAVRLFLGGLPEEKANLVAMANPLTYLPAAAAAAVNPHPTTGPAALPPFLILHGERDTTVPPAQSQILADALTAAGASATFHLVPGLGHGFPARRTEVWDETAAFLERVLK